MIGPANDVNLIRLAMKGGARDYLQEPLDSEELLKNVEALQQEVLAESGSDEGEIIAVIAAKGTINRYHNPCIQSWGVSPDGEVTNVYV